MLNMIMAGGVVVIVLLLGLAIYAVPVVVAIQREHPQTLSIALFSMLLGWTVIGWIAAIIWACCGGHQPRRELPAGSQG